MYNYAKDVEELRNKDLSHSKRVKIVGEESLAFGYPFAKGVKGVVVEERQLETGIPAYKVFTGTRIWIVPQNDCQEI